MRECSTPMRHDEPWPLRQRSRGFSHSCGSVGARRVRLLECHSSSGPAPSWPCWSWWVGCWPHVARNQPSPVDGAAAGKCFGIVVGVEFALVGLGAAILGFTSHPEFIAAWTCLVVGVHFLPLARLFVGIGMAPLAGAVSVVGVAAFVVGATTTVLPSTVAGLGAGACLLGHSASMLLARHPAAG